MARIDPLLGSVRGALGALSFVKGNRVQLRGPGTMAKGGLAQMCSRAMGQLWRLGTEQTFLDWLATCRGEYNGVTLFTRLGSALARSIRAGNFDSIQVLRYGIVPNQPNPKEYPIGLSQEYQPTEVSLVVGAEGTTIRYTFAEDIEEWVDNWRLYFAFNYLQSMSTGVWEPLYTEVIELFGNAGTNYVDFLHEDMTTDLPETTYLGVGAVVCDYTPDDGQPGVQILRGPYNCYAGTFVSHFSLPPCLPPPPPPQE